MQNHLLYYWLSLSRISALRAQKLLEVYAIEELFDRVKSDARIADLVSESVYQKLCEHCCIQIIESEHQKLTDSGINFLAFSDSNFPNKLKQANVPPPVGLYYKGDISLLNADKPYAGIVGTRRSSTYGKDVTYKFSRELVDYSFIIVSGLATGIDAYAHDAALKSNGKTIAVLGMGHNKFWPSDNFKLYNQICDKGLIISEYPPSVEAAKYTFPERNRIVAALSDCLIVTEAAKKSGALITASMALEQGKEIFCVPGNITSVKSQGVNELIKDGARPLTETNDILSFFSLKNAKNMQTIPTLVLDIFEDKLYNLLQSEPLSFDQLLHETQCSIPELTQKLFSLELKGAIARQAGKVYRVVV